MKTILSLCILLLLMFACAGGEDDAPATTSNGSSAGVAVDYTVPEAMEVPAAQEPSSDTDWQARVHNKEIEVIQVLNILNPVAAYLTAGFEQYGSQIKSETVHEEWGDTQVQLTSALELYDSCKKRKNAGEYNKQLFLDMENTWQILVKTGVAGIRTQTMLNDELKKL